MRIYFLIFIFILFFTLKSFAAAPPNPGDPNAEINANLAIIQDQLTVIQSQLTSMSASGIDWNKALSFIAGLMAASSFVISAGRKL